MKDSSELLDLLLSRQGLGIDLTRLLAARMPEDARLEYKDGHILEEGSPREQKQTKKMLREQVSGFGNSQGGVLVIGVADPDGSSEPTSFEVSGAPSMIGGQTINRWVRDVLKDVAPYFDPPIVIPEPISVGEGRCVQLVGVPRSGTLVPCAERGRFSFFMRIGDATLPMEPWLLTDLQLGRRAHPSYSVSITDTEQAKLKDRTTSSDVNFEPMLIVANESLVHSPQTRALILGYQRDSSATPKRVANSLLQRLDIGEPPKDATLACHPAYWAVGDDFFGVDDIDIHPFAATGLKPRDEWALPEIRGAATRTRRWKACLLIFAESFKPSWFQLTFEYRNDQQGRFARLFVDRLFESVPKITAELVDIKEERARFKAEGEL